MLPFSLKKKIRGAEMPQGSMKDVRSINRKALHKQYKENRTNKNRKQYNKQLYHERMSDLERQLGNKREYRKMKRLQAREGKIQLRSGLRHEEMPAETMFVHKHTTRSIDKKQNNFVFGSRGRYEARDLNGNYWDCVVNTCLGDGNYIISIPCSDGITYSKMMAHHSQIRPHLLHNVKGLYEAVDDEQVYWDIVVNDHLTKGHVNINVVADDGTQYAELKTHWNQVRLKIHLNVPNLYEAMDRQGHHWPIEVTRRLGNDMYCFNCHFGDDVMENLKCHHSDIRLVSQTPGMHMHTDDLKKSGIMPKQQRQMTQKHVTLLAPMTNQFTQKQPAPPMPTTAPPLPSGKNRGSKRSMTQDMRPDPDHYAS